MRNSGSKSWVLILHCTDEDIDSEQLSNLFKVIQLVTEELVLNFFPLYCVLSFITWKELLVLLYSEE